MYFEKLDAVLQKYYNERVIHNVYCMREILTLSLPNALKEAAQKMAKKRGFKTVSEYVRFLLEEDKDVIIDAELWEDVQAARRDYREGKCIDADAINLMDLYAGKKN